MSEAAQIGRVYLVGAGPGDPGLLTLRAVECLGLADLVVHDKLVNRRVLDHAPNAQHICVDELPAPHAERHPHLSRLLIEAARKGQTVVRLKAGDPFIFGRGGEEALALAAARVPFEVIPGVTAALAAGACAGIPLTDRHHSSAVAFVTGHECPGKAGSMLDWAALARFPGTLVIYMGLARLGAIAEALIGQGKTADTPAAVIRWASLGNQITISGTLATIARQAQEAKLASPAVTIIGPAVDLRQQLAWFEQRPLFGQRILITRPRRQSDALNRQLENLGAIVYSLPVVEIGPAPDLAAVDRAIARLAEFQWLVFTSANGVQAFLDRVLETGRDLRALASLRLTAIGPRTAEALRSYHLQADLVPSEYRSESLAASLAPQVAGQRVLLARADRGRDVLRDELTKVADVEQVAVYSQADAVEADAEVLGLLRRGEIDFITLTSSNIARGLIRLLDDQAKSHLGQEMQIISISPVTTAAVREMGFEVGAQAKKFTAEGIVEVMLALAGQRNSRMVSQAR